MTRSLLLALVLIIYIVYAAFKYKETWRKLSFPQIAGVFFTFIGVVSISGAILYYGSRYITSAVSGDILVFAIQFIAIIILIAVAGLTFALIASKITNGIIPGERKSEKK